MTATSLRSAVYVSDDNGWLDGCDDFFGTFFGPTEPAGGRYVSYAEGSPYHGGHIEFDDRSTAEAFAARLTRSGDWTVKAPGHESFDQELRPEYAIADIDAA